MISQDFHNFIKLLDRIKYKIDEYFSDPARTTKELAEKKAGDAELAKLATVRTAHRDAGNELIAKLHQQNPPLSGQQEHAAWGDFYFAINGLKPTLVLATGTLLSYPWAPASELVRVLQLEKTIEAAAIQNMRGEGNCQWPSMSSSSSSSPSSPLSFFCAA